MTTALKVFRATPSRPALLSGGYAAALHPVADPVPELLNITKPRAVKAAHADYLAAGATVIRTNTASASPQRLDRYRMHDEAFIVSYMAAEHARDSVRTAAVDGRARTVLGVARVEAWSPERGFLGLDAVQDAVRCMVSGLSGGGADQVLLDAPQEQARLLAAIEGARRGMADAGRSLPIMLKLRYEPAFTVPARARVTEDLKAAACLAS